MNLFRQLTEKPWEGPAELTVETGRSFNLPAATLALRFFLAVVSVLFSLLVIAYADRMLFEDWRPSPPQTILWFNTALLLFSSLAFQWAWMSLKRGQEENVKTGLLVAGFFSCSFLAGQIIAWQQLSASVGYDITNPAVAFFYLITALHGLHLLGGMLVMGRGLQLLWQGETLEKLAPRVRLCAVYWHYLLALWLVLFILLFSGRDNLTSLLAFCGLR
jgi:cytochrome c oxidase subunit 3